MKRANCPVLVNYLRHTLGTVKKGVHLSPIAICFILFSVPRLASPNKHPTIGVGRKGRTVVGNRSKASSAVFPGPFRLIYGENAFQPKKKVS